MAVFYVFCVSVPWFYLVAIDIIWVELNCHTVLTLFWVPRKSYGGLTAAMWWSHGALTAAVRRTCATIVRVVYVRLAVSLRSPHGFWSHESYDRNAVAVTFVTTTTASRKTLRFLKETVDRRTIQRPYGGSRICDRGITSVFGFDRLFVDIWMYLDTSIIDAHVNNIHFRTIWWTNRSDSTLVLSTEEEVCINMLP